MQWPESNLMMIIVNDLNKKSRKFFASCSQIENTFNMLFKYPSHWFPIFRSFSEIGYMLTYQTYLQFTSVQMYIFPLADSFIEFESWRRKGGTLSINEPKISGPCEQCNDPGQSTYWSSSITWTLAIPKISLKNRYIHLLLFDLMQYKKWNLTVKTQLHDLGSEK